jgi:hypothetical protein
MLRERILELGYVLPGDILNVNAFLNHQLDTKLLVQIGKTFAEHFRHLEVTKIVTVETSGIAAAVTTGIELQVPVVFARKPGGHVGAIAGTGLFACKRLRATSSSPGNLSERRSAVGRRRFSGPR